MEPRRSGNPARKEGVAPVVAVVDSGNRPARGDEKTETERDATDIDPRTLGRTRIDPVEVENTGGLHERIGTQTTREIAPATNRNAHLVERRRSRQNRLSKPPGELESEVASLGRQRQVDAPERRAQRRTGSTQLFVVVRTSLARPNDVDTLPVRDVP